MPVRSGRKTRKGSKMPTFLDYHRVLPPMSPDAVQAMVAQIQAGLPGESEVTQWNIFVGQNGQAWCLCEAPDAEAVVQSHEAMLFVQNLENVVEVTKLV